MVKKRPVIVLTPAIQGRSQIVTVVALSTSTPEPQQNFHCVLPKASLPQLGSFQVKDTWVKGDMIYSVGWHRLDLIRLNKRKSDGKRAYFNQRLGRDSMRDVYSCVLHGMNLGSLAMYL